MSYNYKISYCIKRKSGGPCHILEKNSMTDCYSKIMIAAHFMTKLR